MRNDDPKSIRMDHLLKAITHQSELIKARVAAATLLRPPYETLSEEQQADLLANKWLCIKEEALARSEELLAQRALFHVEHLYARHSLDAVKAFQEVAEESEKLEPNQQSIDWFTQSASFFQQAAEAIETGQFQKVRDLSDKGNALFNAAIEEKNRKTKQ